ncbi:MAG: XisH family protein [candidate division KSB1 bacterium]
MPARDFYHDAVVKALIADGWKITHDPLTLSYGGEDLYVDLGAERTAIAAEKNGEKIAVEVKSFLSPSRMHDLQEAVGKYNIYHSILSSTEPDRRLYLAIPLRTYEGIFSAKFGQLIMKRLRLRLLVFDEKQERILEWIN